MDLTQLSLGIKVFEFEFSLSLPLSLSPRQVLNENLTDNLGKKKTVSELEFEFSLHLTIYRVSWQTTTSSYDKEAARPICSES